MWWIGVAAALTVVIWLVLQARESLRRQRLQDARFAVRVFRYRREMLEAKFLDLARAHGKPRGLIWSECDWLPEVSFARDRESGLLTAFVAIRVHFRPEPDGDMEDVEAVAWHREATALFHYDRGTWGTGGRVLFNLQPHDALERFHRQFEPVLPG